MNHLKSQPFGFPTSTIRAKREKLMETKICTKCKRELPATLEYFRKSKACRFGVTSVCRDCLTTIDREYRKNNIERLRQYDRERYPARKEERSAYYKQWYLENKDKVRDYNKARREEHKEYYKETHKKYYEANKDRYKQWAKQYREANKDHHRIIKRLARSRRRAIERSAGGKYTEDDVRAMYKRQKGKCYYCGEKVGKKYHVDHVVPLSRGGSNSPDNLVIACPYCNDSKGTKLVHEWEKGGRLL
jgi:5-methylcytosine-specific restriction endonuclease McrA